MNMSWMELLLLGLASFRLTRLMIYDTITSFLRRPFHEWMEEELSDGTIETYLHIKGKGLRRWIGELLSCYWCAGIWCTLLIVGGHYFLPYWSEPIIIILAIAGFAAIIETVISKLINQ